MTTPPNPEEVLDISGPEDESLFWNAKAFLIQGRVTEFQRELDRTWAHYEGIDDARLLALVGALCVEGAVDGLLLAVMPGYGQYTSDTDFKFSVKIKVVRALRVMPSRIVTSCDLIRQIRNEFAHSLELRSLSELKEPLRNKLLPHVTAFASEKWDPTDYTKQLRSLIGFILAALWIYTEQNAELRKFVGTKEGRELFKTWAERNVKSLSAG